MRVALRRQQGAVIGEPTVEIGPLTIDLAARAVLLDGKQLELTPKEYRLLQVLAHHAGNVVTHQHLLQEVWGSTHVNDRHYLRIFVRKIRRKIERDPDSPRILVTELGVGYGSRSRRRARTGPGPPRRRPPISRRNLIAVGRGQIGSGRYRANSFSAFLPAIRLADAGFKRVDPGEAAGHVAQIVRIVRAVEHALVRARHRQAQVERTLVVHHSIVPDALQVMCSVLSLMTSAQAGIVSWPRSRRPAR